MALLGCGGVKVSCVEVNVIIIVVRLRVMDREENRPRVRHRLFSKSHAYQDVVDDSSSTIHVGICHMHQMWYDR